MSKKASGTVEKIAAEAKKIPLVNKHWRGVKFVAVGGLNTVLDFLIYGFLANMIGVPQILANIISTTICIMVSFYLNYHYVWKSKKSKRETAPGFLVVSFFSAWVMQSIGIKLCLFVVGEGPIRNLVAKVIGSCLGIMSNYFGYKVVFTKNVTEVLRKIIKIG